MASYTRYLLASALLAVGISAQSCPYVPYTNITHYPTTGKCAPTNYDFELDLGEVSLKDAKHQCQEECTASDADCHSVVIELYENKASHKYSAKCLLFAYGNDATEPEQCSDPACILEGYTKDDPLACYSALPVPATSYCQSVLSATVTQTITAVPAANTRVANNTLTAYANSTTLLTNTVEATTTLTATTTIYTSPVVTTDTATITSIITTSTTRTLTATSVTVKTVTVTQALKKRTTQAAATIPAPSCITSDTPASRLSSACVEFDAAPVTVKTTVTAAPAVVTRTANQTITLTKPVTEFVSITITDQSVTNTVPQTVEVDQTASTSTTVFSTTTITSTATVTTVSTSTTTKFVSPTPSVYCGLPDGYVATGPATGSITCSAVAEPSHNVYFRIEGANDTPYEGCLVAGPKNITTPSGGTHLCDGTNNNANPAPGTTGTSLIDAAGRLKGFDYDGTWTNAYQDFFITRISTSAQGGNQYWGILYDEVFTPTGGCQFEYYNNDRALWAYNAFNVNFFLTVSPQWSTILPGQTVTVTVSGNDGNGNVNPIAGASIAGVTTTALAIATNTAPTTPGCYPYKAQRSDSIRSNTFYMNVYSSF